VGQSATGGACWEWSEDGGGLLWWGEEAEVE